MSDWNEGFDLSEGVLETKHGYRDGKRYLS
jgi:hypothetical protein